MATKILSVNEREFLDLVIEFIKSLAIKNPYMVQKYETDVSAHWAANYIYILDCRDEISFEFFDYTIDDLKAIGIINRDLLKLLSEDNNLIPQEFRYQLLENKLNYYEKEYVEYNDYFRMLNGEPPIDSIDSEYIYVTVEDSTGATVRKPIHTLTNNEFYQIYASGEYDQILLDNPTIQYLYYVNPANKISYYTARKTKDFYIMGYNDNILEELYSKQIIDLYYEVLVYTMSVVYTPAHEQMDYYDSYIIMYMLTATLQKFLNTNVENAMRRDVYDLTTIRNIYESYGLPFIEDIPLKYQKLIVKNINKLLAYKGTDKVFADIGELFGFTNTQLYKYYLVKDYKRNSSGQPISTEDLPENYELKFAQVDTETNDISSYLKKEYLYQSYEDVVWGDPYWGEQDAGEIDEELKEEIKRMEFNYVSTKYLSTTTVFNMSECVYETIYFFNLLTTLQANAQIDTLYFYNTDIKDNGEPIYLYSAITALYILLFRRFGYSDTLPSSVTGIASVYGFNFSTDLDPLKEYVARNSTIDMDNKKINYILKEADIEHLLKILEMPTNPTKGELLDTYFSNKDYDTALRKLMLSVEDYRVYRALSSIHNYNLYSQAIKDVYGSDYPDTTHYETFTDWLKDHDILLASWVDSVSYDSHGSIDKVSIINAIDDLLDCLEMYFYNANFSNLFINTNITVDIVRRYFLKVISIFKAYTVELKNINIYYMFDDKFLNTIKLFSEMKKVASNTLADSIERELAESISSTITNIFYNERDLEKLEEYVYTILQYKRADSFHIDFDKLIRDNQPMHADSIEREVVDCKYIISAINKSVKEHIKLTEKTSTIVKEYIHDNKIIKDIENCEYIEIIPSHNNII